MTPKERKQSDETNIAVMASNISDIKEDVKDIKLKLGSDYVTKEAFEPIKRIVYGMVALVMTAVGGGLLSLILRK